MTLRSGRLLCGDERRQIGHQFEEERVAVRGRLADDRERTLALCVTDRPGDSWAVVRSEPVLAGIGESVVVVLLVLLQRGLHRAQNCENVPSRTPTLQVTDDDYATILQVDLVYSTTVPSQITGWKLDGSAMLATGGDADLRRGRCAPGEDTTRAEGR